MPRPQWIWDGKRPFGDTGCFRKAFEVGEGVVSAWVQITGDDSYRLFLNGTEVACGGFAFGAVDTHEISNHLLPGRNVLAVECRNAVDPAGIILRCTVNYTKQPPQVFATDSTWRMSRQVFEGWQCPEFDDSAWQTAVQIGEPPVGPWGPLPFSDLAEDGARIELLDVKAPDTARAGGQVEILLRLMPDAVPKSDYAAKISLCRGSVELVPQDFKVILGTSAWEKGRAAAVPAIRIPISRYAPSGAYELRFGIERMPWKDTARTEALIKTIRIRGEENKAAPPKAEIRPHNGAPAVWVNGSPIAAMAYADVGPPSLRHTRRFADAGIKLYHQFSAASLGWVAPGRFDFSPVDYSMMTVLEGNPDALIIPRVSIQAPEWWLQSHPDQIIGYAAITGHRSDVYGGTRFPSMASEIWLKDAGDALRQYVRHIASSPYAGRVIGYHIGSGIYGEWHYPGSEYLPDTSAPMTEAFRRWLKREYGGDVAALRAAWNDPDAEFESAQVPRTEERLSSDFGIFRDPRISRRVIDYYRCYHEVLSDAILHFAKIVKEETQGRALVSIFYGYTSNVLWTQEGGHWNLQAILDSPYVDILCSPHTYVGRRLGEDGYLRALPGSIRMHGKFFMDESDDRTHLVAGSNQFRFADTPEESAALLRREFANVVTQGFGQWWFDMDSCWFDSPPLMAEIASLRQAAERSLALPRLSAAQIAVFASEDSVFYTANWKSGKDRATDLLLNEQWRELAKMGAPYDLYELKDIARPGFPDYRCYIFLNCFYVPKAVREAVENKVKREGRAALWIYAPGLIDETGLGGDRMTALTGIELDAAAVETQPVYDPSKDSGLKIERLPGWVSIYSPGPVVSSKSLREVARIAGCHVYSDSDDPFFCNSSYVALHSRTAGTKRISLPRRCTVRDALTGELIARSAGRFAANFKRHETRIFELVPTAP